MIKSPIGLLFATAGLLLAVSPEARKSARKLAVKGTELLLDLNDQWKSRSTAVKLANITQVNNESASANKGTLQTE